MGIVIAYILGVLLMIGLSAFYGCFELRGDSKKRLTISEIVYRRHIIKLLLLFVLWSFLFGGVAPLI